MPDIFDEVAAPKGDIFDAIAGTKRTRAEVAASIPPSDLPGPFAQRALNTLAWLHPIVQTLTPAGMLNALTIPQPAQPKPFTISPEGISQEPGTIRPQPFAAGQPLIKSPFVNRDINPLSEVVSQLIEGATTPETIVTAPAFGGEGTLANLVKGYYALTGAKQAGESFTQAVAPSSTPSERVVGGLNTLVNAGISLGAARSMLPAEPALTGIKPEVDPYANVTAWQRSLENAKREAQAAPVVLGQEQPIIRSVELAPSTEIVPAAPSAPKITAEPEFPPAGPMPYPKGTLPTRGELVTQQSGVPSRLLAKEVESASTIRSHQTVIPQAEEQAGQTEIQRVGGGEPRSEDLQRNAPEGQPTSGQQNVQELRPLTPEQTKLYSVPGMAFDPDFYRNIAKKTETLRQKVGEALQGAESRPIVGTLKFDTKSPLPDLQEKNVANEVAAQGFGTERVFGLGRIMGGKARIRTPQDESVAAWHNEYHGVAPAVASMTGETIYGKITRVFKAADNGDLNVRPTQPGQSLKISDVFEALQRNPESYRLTPEQRRVFNETIRPITDRMQELAKRYGITDDAEKGYFTRVVTKHPAIEEPVGPRVGRPLAKSFVQKERAFATEQEGWQKGYRYELDPERRLVSGVEALYKAIANKRLANDPVLGARTPKQVKAELRQTFAEDLASGKMTEDQIDRMVQGIHSRGMVMQPMLMSKIFPPDVARTLNREFAAEASRLRQKLVSVNSLIKATQLGFDFGVGQIQLLPTLYNNPRIWAQANWEGIKNMASPRFFAEYVQKHQQSVNELAQLGSPVGRLQEMVAGVGKGELLSKVPVVGEVGQAFGRQFQAAIDVAKIELWESLSKNVPKQDWPKLVRAVEGMTLTGRMESAMVSRSRAQLERVALLAPSYYRGALDNLVAALIEKGPAGTQSRIALGKFIAGSTITFGAIAKLLGMSDDEILKRLNPARSDFMTWQIKHADGSIVNVGFGGVHRSVLRLLGNVVKTGIEHPENFKSLAPDKNPLTKWYRGHAGPVVSLTWEGLGGKDYLGRESDVSGMAARTLPLIAQQAITPAGEQPAKPVEYAASFTGLSAFPESFSARRQRELEDVSQAQRGKPYEQLNIGQRAKAEKAVEEKLKGVPTGLTPQRAREIAQRKEDERTAKLITSLPPEIQSWAESNKLTIPGYQATREINRTRIQLTEKELDLLHNSMVEAYSNTLEKLRQSGRIDNKSDLEKQRYVNVNLDNARQQAWQKVYKAIKQSARASQEPVR